MMIGIPTAANPSQKNDGVIAHPSAALVKLFCSAFKSKIQNQKSKII